MQPTSALMRQAAQAFLSGLAPVQREEATFSFEDEQRFVWHFTPIPRKGLALRDMLPHQQKLALALVASGYSTLGNSKVMQIMSLEQVLHEFEQGAERRFVRDPDLYFVTIFGEPSDSATWGWRFEGHHVSINVTLAEGKQFTTTPSFFGANPAEVKLGPRAGLRVLAAEEDAARELLRSLDDRQRARAIFAAEAPRDILSFNHHRAGELGDAGITADALSAGQRDRLMTLLEAYAATMPPEVAVARARAAQKAPLDKLRFAWAGGAARGEQHYFRVQSPTFLVEYDNTQNGGNHIHSVWRDFTGDWGADLLGQHLAAAHA